MNMLEETRRGYIISAQMKEVWAVQMELLQKLMSVCDENNLNVWVDSGTLLGAVREKGFIPWDDDIDVIMLREDYDKLLALAPIVFSSPYFLQTAHNTPEFPIGFAKLRKDGTTFIIRPDAFQKMHHGIFIDIFVLDGYPETTPQKQYLMKQLSTIKHDLWLNAYFHSLALKTPCKYWAYFQSKHRIKKAGGVEAYVEKWESLLRQTPASSSRKVDILTFNCNRQDGRYLREWYNGTLLVQFEDMQAPIPSGYHKILTACYGDYMTPKHVPTAHGGQEILMDAHRDYKEYQYEFCKKIKRERRKKAIEKIKHIFHV